MFYQILHNKTVQALSGWVGLLSMLLTVLSKLTPEWFGKLTWPQAILAGLCGALGGTLVVALILAIFAYAFRLIRPAALNGEALRPQATADFASPSSPVQLVEAYDDSDLRRNFSDLSRHVSEINGAIEAISRRVTDMADANTIANGNIAAEVGELHRLIGAVAQPLIAQAQLDFLNKAKPLEIAQHRGKLSGTSIETEQLRNFERGEAYSSLRDRLIEFGFDISELDNSIGQGLDRLKASPEYLNIWAEEAGQWESQSQKQAWLERKLRFEAMNEFLEKVKRKVESPILGSGVISRFNGRVK